MGKLLHVILSGGVGSRLWPVSRRSMPKQYIPMFGGKSLFQLTAERNRDIADTILVIGNRENYFLSKTDLLRAEIFQYDEIIESVPRNTAAAVAFAAFHADPEDILLVTPSDHIITKPELYLACVKEARSLAEQGYLVTFGIAPTKPETGFGYIEFSGNDVLSFREKPDIETAESFINSGSFLWNSGMFCFRADAFLADLKLFEPKIFSASEKAYISRTDGFIPELETLEIPSQSIDYAVMERSQKMKVVKADFGWSDLGSFESIWEHWDLQGETHRFKNNNCVIGSEKHVEFLGVSNLVLVETNDAILILDKSRSQDVKTIFERLERDRPELVK
ncbi:mannose-1-phosphate guanylyltransferase [Dyadobacter sp. Leaf189]|uniref:mannose-1-phosphate guanylyltransferase n=1 Tax=Dyadobacter sp. Leaf189 TaxID=1736295 RepID=UPI0006F90499|nr:sugar phosphate nucleotidyltransferase [Dyadobacter sp. Leaf189]KQS30691.1 mannose-1-phosphate guanylyltransferase [Dyadobacter sp. Leaf189]